MAYQGYLIKVGNYTIPFKYMKTETYQVLKSGQDLDSYRDADGGLHRTALDHFLYKVEFETPPLKDFEIEDLLKNIRKQYIKGKETEKKLSMNLYVPETNSYATQDAYIPDINFTIFYADEDEIQYNGTRIAFIGY